MSDDQRARRLSALRDALEEQFRVRTEQLATLMAEAEGVAGGDVDTVTALQASCRQALADIARALRYMVEGRYGFCEGCRGEIPVERLEILPQARFCVPCQERRG